MISLLSLTHCGFNSNPQFLTNSAKNNRKAFNRSNQRGSVAVFNSLVLATRAEKERRIRYAGDEFDRKEIHSKNP